MILPILTSLLGLASGSIERYQARKQVEAEAEAKITVARAEAEAARLAKAQDAEIAWENAAVGQMETSWKDEYFTILLSIPAITAFFPGGPEVVQSGFAALATMPDWYIYAFLTAIAASFGIRSLLRLAKIR